MSGDIDLFAAVSRGKHSNSAERYVVVDVFTDTPLEGNQLGVFTDARGLSDAEMQAVARETRLSETTFIVPRDEATERADGVKVRIFTVAEEMPFARHPTLGTAFVCRALGLGGNSLQLEMKAGTIPVSAAGDRWTLTAPTPTWREPDRPASRSGSQTE